MLPDPVTVAANAPTPSLVFAVIKSDGFGTERVDTGGNGYTMTTNHTYQKGGGDKHYLQIRQVVTAADPYSTLNKKQTASVSMTIVRPSFGFTDAAIVALAKALMDYLNDSEVTPARIVQFQS